MSAQEDRDKTGARPADQVYAEQRHGFAQAVAQAVSVNDEQQREARDFLASTGMVKPPVD